MARIEHKKFVPTPEEARLGATPMDKLQIIESLEAYKKQNPTKYEAKKEALFARYGLSLEEEAQPAEPDESDKELTTLKKKAKAK